MELLGLWVKVVLLMSCAYYACRAVGYTLIWLTENRIKAWLQRRRPNVFSFCLRNLKFDAVLPSAWLFTSFWSVYWRVVMSPNPTVSAPWGLTICHLCAKVPYRATANFSSDLTNINYFCQSRWISGFSHETYITKRWPCKFSEN